jgi:hypothetical protein
MDIFDPDYLPNPKKPNFDMVSACWSIKNSSPIQWEAIHIKGHQDRHAPIQALSREARLNVEMDRVAGAYWIHLTSQSENMPAPTTRAIYGEEWQLWNGDHKITHPTDKILYSIFQDPETDMWWRREGHILAEARKAIDYDAAEEAMKSLTTAQRKYITKSASENYGVGRTLVEWKHQTNAQCPRCQQAVETPAHVQQCEGYAANEVFQKSIQKVDEFLSKESTRPDLQDAIIQCIKKWRAKEPIQLNEYDTEIQDVLIQQHAIGWLDMMECLPAKGWQKIQRQYYNEQNICKSSRRWIKGLLRQLQSLGHQQWKHRCDVKANITRPQEAEHVEIMHDEIERQLIQGGEDLLPGDKSILEYSILDLMHRSLAYKKGWLARIWAARQRAKRIAMKNDEIVVQSKEAACLRKWMSQHKDRPKRRTRRRETTIADTEMEEVSGQHDGGIIDSEYLMECVRENMQHQTGSEERSMEQVWTEQSVETIQGNLSNVISCVNKKAGFEEPDTNPHIYFNFIVDNRNP